MKKQALSIIVLFICFVGFSQSTDDKIAEFLGGQSALEFQRQNNPEYISYLRTRVNHGYAITTFNETRHLNYVTVSVLSKKIGTEIIQETVEQFLESYNNGSLNILLYVFPDNGDDSLILKLGNTNQVLILHSTAKINELVHKL